MMSESSVASQEYLEWLIKILEGSQGYLGSSPQKPQTRSRSWSKGQKRFLERYVSKKSISWGNKLIF